MSAQQFIVSKSNSRAEMFTTDLGLAAYEGRLNEIERAIENGIDWNAEEPYLLMSAIFGEQWNVVRALIKGGMPISNSVYKHIYYWADHSLLLDLPPNPDLLKQLNDQSLLYKLQCAVIEGDIEEVKRLFRPEWIEIESDFLGDRVARRLLHYAAWKCHLELIDYLLAAGADVSALSGDGRSALTLVARCPSVDKYRRRQCFKILADKGAQLVPPVNGWFNRWSLARGGWLRDF